jgi:hypothetical protein
MMKPPGLGYLKIDVCPNFCMLYYLESAKPIGMFGINQELEREGLLSHIKN